MKRRNIFTTLLILVMMFALAACSGSNAARESATQSASSKEVSKVSGSESDKSGETSQSEGAASESGAGGSSVAQSSVQENTDGSKVLVVYFSRTGEQYGVGNISEGNTAIVAKMIAEITGGDTFEILPENDNYPTTYDALTDVAKQEQNDNARPAYKAGVPDLSKYDTIFIGAPVWWGDWPIICYTFFENENLSGKTLYPFATHAGSGLSGFDNKLSAAVNDATVGEGFSVPGSDCQNNQDSVRSKVNEWLSKIGY